MREALTAFISAQRGVDVEITMLSRISVGHSRAMFRVDCRDGARYVLRMEQGGVFGTSSAEEFAVMRALHLAHVPVARVLWYDPTGDTLGRPFFIMDFVPGAEQADERLLDDVTTRSLVAVLQRLHGLDWRAHHVPFATVAANAVDATHLEIDKWAGRYRGASPHRIALLEEAAAWLHHHAPPLEHLAVVHGDAGPGNFVHDGAEVLAITDWEFAHLGDPAEDWVFCATMRGARTMPLQAWTALLDNAGVHLTAFQWRYWEAFNLFKGACANRTCLDLFEHGGNRAPNMAIIGTSLHQAFLRRLTDLVGP